MIDEFYKFSVERDESGAVTEVFFDDEHEYISYEALMKEKNFRLTRGTSFQQAVWLELLNIPCGQTISYQEMAARVGSPKAQQAVGQALAKNPLPVILPCHRVTQKDGKLGGFAGKDKRTDIKLAILADEITSAAEKAKTLKGPASQTGQAYTPETKGQLTLF